MTDAAGGKAIARRGRDIRLQDAGVPCSTGTFVTIAGFVPIGFAASSAGEYTFSIFAVVGIALIVSWFVAVIFAPLLGMAFLAPPKTAQRSEPGMAMRDRSAACSSPPCGRDG